MCDPMIGEIRMFAGDFAPSGWALCNGSLLSVTQNSVLFSIIGNRYGGDGRTTFALPDLRGRGPIGPGQGPGLSPVELGQSAGNENVTLSIAQLPPHAPSVTVEVAIPAASVSASPAAVPAANLSLGPVAAGGRAGTLYAPEAPDVTLKPFSAKATVGPVGAGSPVPIRDPYLGLNFIIAIVGVYPSRD